MNKDLVKYLYPYVKSNLADADNEKSRSTPSPYDLAENIMKLNFRHPMKLDYALNDDPNEDSKIVKVNCLNQMYHADTFLNLLTPIQPWDVHRDPDRIYYLS